jgi:hypothetical protein
LLFASAGKKKLPPHHRKPRQTKSGGKFCPKPTLRGRFACKQNEQRRYAQGDEDANPEKGPLEY